MSTQMSGRRSKRKIMTIDTDEDDDIIVEKEVRRFTSSQTVSSAKTRRLDSGQSSNSIFQRQISPRGPGRPKSKDLICSLWQPQKVNDLAVHPDKIKEIRNWLSARKSSKGTLLLTGPKGSGKSTALRVIANSMGIVVVDWDRDDEFELRTYGEQEIISQDSELNAFFKFLRSDPIALSQPSSSRSPHVLLVENIPYQAFSDFSAFQARLSAALRFCRHSVVFCLSDMDRNYKMSPQFIFREKFRRDSGIDTIAMNPIANKFLKSGLMRIMEKVDGGSSQRFSQKFLNEVVEACNGDIRSAINMVEFSVSSESCSSGQLSLCPSLEAVSNDELFHKLGRILYAKRVAAPSNIPPPPSWMPSHLVRPPTERDVNYVLEMSATSNIKVMSYLHEHEPNFSPYISSSRHFLDSISLADSLTSRWDLRDQSIPYAEQISARATMFYNYCPNGETGAAIKQRALYKYKKPKWDDLEKHVRETSFDLRSCVHMVERGADAMYLEFPMLHHIRGCVDDSQLAVVSFLSRPMSSFPWHLGRSMFEQVQSQQRQRLATSRSYRTSSVSTGVTASLDGSSCLPPPFALVMSRHSLRGDADENSADSDQFTIEDSSDDADVFEDSFDDPVTSFRTN